MYTTRFPLLGATILAVIATAALADAPGPASLSKPVTQLQYGATGVTDGVHGEVRAAAAYGDLGHGAHGTFLKMPGEFVSPLHSHSGDEWGVILAGVVANGKPGSQDIPLPAGSDLFLPEGPRAARHQMHLAERVHHLPQPELEVRLPAGHEIGGRAADPASLRRDFPMTYSSRLTASGAGASSAAAR